MTDTIRCMGKSAKSGRCSNRAVWKTNEPTAKGKIVEYRVCDECRMHRDQALVSLLPEAISASINSRWERIER